MYALGGGEPKRAMFSWELVTEDRSLPGKICAHLRTAYICWLAARARVSRERSMTFEGGIRFVCAINDEDIFHIDLPYCGKEENCRI